MHKLTHPLARNSVIYYSEDYITFWHRQLLIYHLVAAHDSSFLKFVSHLLRNLLLCLTIALSLIIHCSDERQFGKVFLIGVIILNVVVLTPGSTFRRLYFLRK